MATMLVASELPGERRQQRKDGREVPSLASMPVSEVMLHVRGMGVDGGTQYRAPPVPMDLPPTGRPQEPEPGGCAKTPVAPDGLPPSIFSLTLQAANKADPKDLDAFWDPAVAGAPAKASMQGKSRERVVPASPLLAVAGGLGVSPRMKTPPMPTTLPPTVGVPVQGKSPEHVVSASPLLAGAGGLVGSTRMKTPPMPTTLPPTGGVPNSYASTRPPVAPTCFPPTMVEEIAKTQAGNEAVSNALTEAPSAPSVLPPALGPGSARRRSDSPPPGIFSLTLGSGGGTFGKTAPAVELANEDTFWEEKSGGFSFGKEIPKADLSSEDAFWNSPSDMGPDGESQNEKPRVCLGAPDVLAAALKQEGGNDSSPTTVASTPIEELPTSPSHALATAPPAPLCLPPMVQFFSMAGNDSDDEASSNKGSVSPRWVKDSSSPRWCKDALSPDALKVDESGRTPSPSKQRKGKRFEQHEEACVVVASQPESEEKIVAPLKRMSTVMVIPSEVPCFSMADDDSDSCDGEEVDISFSSPRCTPRQIADASLFSAKKLQTPQKGEADLSSLPSTAASSDSPSRRIFIPPLKFPPQLGHPTAGGSPNVDEKTSSAGRPASSLLSGSPLQSAETGQPSQKKTRNEKGARRPPGLGEVSHVVQRLCSSDSVDCASPQWGVSSDLETSSPVQRRDRRHREKRASPERSRKGVSGSPSRRLAPVDAETSLSSLGPQAEVDAKQLPFPSDSDESPSGEVFARSPDGCPAAGSETTQIDGELKEYEVVDEQFRNLQERQMHAERHVQQLLEQLGSQVPDLSATGESSIQSSESGDVESLGATDDGLSVLDSRPATASARTTPRATPRGRDSGLSSAGNHTTGGHLSSRSSGGVLKPFGSSLASLASSPNSASSSPTSGKAHLFTPNGRSPTHKTPDAYSIQTPASSSNSPVHRDDVVGHLPPPIDWPTRSPSFARPSFSLSGLPTPPVEDSSNSLSRDVSGYFGGGGGGVVPVVSGNFGGGGGGVVGAQRSSASSCDEEPRLLLGPPRLQLHMSKPQPDSQQPQLRAPGGSYRSASEQFVGSGPASSSGAGAEPQPTRGVTLPRSLSQARRLSSPHQGAGGSLDHGGSSVSVADEELKLALAWKCVATPEGRLFFHNEPRGISQWHQPSDLRSVLGDWWETVGDSRPGAERFWRNDVLRMSLRKDPRQTTNIFQAALDGNLFFLQLYAGVDGVFDVADPKGRQALHYCCAGGATECAMFLLQRRSQVNVDCLDKSSSTPLHSAARYGSTPMVKVLLDAGANVNAVNSFGNTPLHEAASAGQLDCLHLLLLCGADARPKNVDGNTAAKAALRNNHPACVTLLERHQQYLPVADRAPSPRFEPKADPCVQKASSSISGARRLSSNTALCETAIVAVGAQPDSGTESDGNGLPASSGDSNEGANSQRDRRRRGLLQRMRDRLRGLSAMSKLLPRRSPRSPRSPRAAASENILAISNGTEASRDPRSVVRKGWRTWGRRTQTQSPREV